MYRDAKDLLKHGAVLASFTIVLILLFGMLVLIGPPPEEPVESRRNG